MPTNRCGPEPTRRAGTRGGTWSVSALYGSPAKGAGVLNNELYVGRYVWNRSLWVKDPDTGKRTRIDRPRTEWQIDERAELRIVPDAAFNAVRARIGKANPRTGTYRKGATSTTLFGGLLRCARCGGAMVAVDARQYGCVARKDRGSSVCTGTLTPRKETDARLLAAIRDDLVAPTTISQVRAQAARALAEHDHGADAVVARKSVLRREIHNLADAIASLGLSDALRVRLATAERELKELDRRPAQEAMPTPDEIVGIYRSFILNLSETLATDIERARAALGHLLGSITIEATTDGVVAEMTTRPDRVLLAVAGAQMGLVAGAGFGTRLRTWILRNGDRTAA